MDSPTVDGTGFTISVSVDEHRASALAEGFGKFGGKLVAGYDLNILTEECLGKHTAGVPAEPVVTAQRIPVTDDKSSGQWTVDSG